MPPSSPPSDAQRMALLRAELLGRIRRAMREDGRAEPLAGLHLYRVSEPYAARHGLFIPALCLIAQGTKAVHVGDHTHPYDPYHYLLTTVAVPGVGQVLEASPDEPYLSLRLALDPLLVSSVLIEAGHAMPKRHASVSAVDVSPVDLALLDAVVRLVRLIENPEEVPVLQPLITREIVYRLLVGAQGDRLRHAAVLGGHRHRIAQAVSRLRDDFDQTIRMEHLASDLGMSLSSFHHQFKAITGMSPLGFQKQVRLQEARRLLLAEDLDAATAGQRVGYDNASHFSRAYKRHFGKPPRQDVEAQRRTC